MVKLRIHVKRSRRATVAEGRGIKVVRERTKGQYMYMLQNGHFRPYM